MHPPFLFTDHKVGPDIYTPKPKARRGSPARLDLTPAPGWPPVPLIAPQSILPLGPSGRPFMTGVHLAIVPPPRDTLRDMIGRWLIRTGQRMILTNGPG